MSSSLQGYLAHKKTPPSHDRHKTLGIALQQGPKGGLFRMSEVSLYSKEGRIPAST